MSVEVCAVVPVMSTEVGLRLQVGASAPDGGVQLTLTVPVKPSLGVTVMVEVPLPPGPVMEMPSLLERSKPGTRTLAVVEVVVVIAPEMPVTVTM